MCKWINVNDSLPEECEDVLVYTEWESAGIDSVSKGEGVKIGWQIGGRWHIDGKCRVVGKYWMAIPKLNIMIYDWPDAYRMVCMHICRDNNKPCEYANHNGYCQITACIKQPEYVRIENIPPEQWMKSREE